MPEEQTSVKEDMMGWMLLGMAEKTGLLREKDWPPGKILPLRLCRQELARFTAEDRTINVHLKKAEG